MFWDNAYVCLDQERKKNELFYPLITEAQMRLLSLSLEEI